jgi:hypothetical protein
LSEDATKSSLAIQSGVVIGNKLVLTSLNSVNDSTIVNVFRHNSKIPYGAGLIWKDSVNNIAIFMVPELKCQPIKMKKSSDLSQIDEIMIMNCGRRDSTYLESTWGILSGSPADTLITVGAAVNPGGIGAPVITMDGSLAGVIVDKEVNLFTEGIAYMVNIDLIHAALADIDYNKTPIGAIKDYKLIELIGKAFENEMLSYKAEKIKDEIELLLQAKEYANESDKYVNASSLSPAYLKTYFYHLLFNALAQDYQEELASKTYDEFLDNAIKVKEEILKRNYPDGIIPETERIKLKKEYYPKMSFAADEARMEQAHYKLDGILTSIRRADFYGYLFYGTTPKLFKKILND